MRIFLVLFSLLLFIPQLFPSFQSCKLDQNSTKDTSSAESVCYRIQNTKWRACKERVEDSVDAKISITFEKNLFAQVKALSYLGDLNDFDYRRVPLANWGKVHIIANRETESNGIAVQNWRLTIIGENRSVELSVEDYGPSSLIQDPENPKYCRILRTKWDFASQPSRMLFSSLLWDGKLFHEALPSVSLPLTKRLENKRLNLKLGASWQEKHIIYDPLQLF